MSSRHAKEQQKKHYDRKAKNHTFEPGDRVLIKVCQVEGRQKLEDRWELQPYVVLKKQPGVPVYMVRSENGEKERVVIGESLIRSPGHWAVSQMEKTGREEMGRRIMTWSSWRK